jgi:hypothetical protein
MVVPFGRPGLGISGTAVEHICVSISEDCNDVLVLEVMVVVMVSILSAKLIKVLAILILACVAFCNLFNFLNGFLPYQCSTMVRNLCIPKQVER